MTGTFVKKYHVAILDDEVGVLRTAIHALKEWYSNKIVIKVYDNCSEMFEAINVSKVKNKPFDCAVLDPKKYPEKMVLQNVNPELPIVVYHDVESLKKDTEKILL